MLSPGVVLSGRYLLEERIAAGGMGEVWRGTDTLLKRRIAVKVLLPSLVSDSDFITRFRTEARLMAALRHPGIVQVYDGGEDRVAGTGTIDYLVMELVDGTALSAAIDAAGALDPRRTLTIIAQAADALQVAHEAGIVHRDVKPSNLLIRPGGAVVLVDFGIARSTEMTSITGTNVVMGTAHYMAPEQAEGKPVNPATDVYALGAVAYCCLTGRPPYVGEGPLQVLTQLVYGEPATLPPSVPPAVAEVVLRAMDRNPARRYPSAAAFAAAARSVLGNGTTGSRAAHPVSPALSYPPAASFRAAPPQAVPPRAAPFQPVPPGSVPPQPVPSRSPRSQSTPFGAAVAVPTARAFSAGQASPAGQAPHANRAFAAGQATPTSPAFQDAERGAESGAGRGADMGAQGWVTGSGARVATSPPGRRKRTIIALLAAVLAIGVGAWAILGLPHTGRSEAQTQPGPIAGATSNHGKATATNPGRKASTRPPKTAAPTEAPTSPAPTTSDDSQAAGTPRDVCGSAFRVIDSAPLRSDGTLLGRVYLLRDDDTGRTCATTFKTADQGEPTTVSVYLKLGDDPGADDDSQDEDYAGPVTVQSDGTCVLWGGAVNDVSFDSPSDRCE